MKKRFLAVLLCLCMVLGMVPSGITIPVSAETVEELTVDESGQGFCEACNKTVSWTAFSGNAEGTQAWGLKKDGGHYHVYLSADVNARKIVNDFINLQNNTKLCLHLNGHNLVHGGYIFIANSTLNIMGDGNVIFTATNTGNGYDQAGLYSNAGTFNLYGGTYSVAEDALNEGKPAMKLALVNSAANVVNATIKGQAIITNGTLTLDGASNVENIQVETGGKLFVKSGWTGEAQANFATALENNVVPAANGGTDGEFTGTLKMQQGLVLKGSETGTLTAAGINANLVLDENSQALCPVCNETVTWTAFSGNAAGTQRYGQVDDGKHYHVYLPADVNAKAIADYFMHVFNKSQMCLHLNGYDLTYGGYIYVSNSVLNVMGQGNMTFTGTKTSAGYDQAGLYMNKGTINLYGGSYRVAEVAETAGKPMIYLNDAGSVVVKNAEVYGQTYIKMGTLTLENEADLENIQVETGGKLIVKGNWSGSAKVAFAAQPEEYQIPAANASAESGFTGSLKLADGSQLLADGNGGLYIKNINANLTVDENGEALCPVCDKVVKWTAFSGNDSGNLAMGTKKDGGHYHVYLAGDVNARKIANDFINLQSGTKMCLHLNGHDLVYGGYIFAAASTLNVMGHGNVIFTATNTSNTYDQAALYANESGIFNLYGGTYSVAEDALAEGKPTLCLALANSQAKLQNVTVSGQTLVKNGTLTMEEGTNVESIQVEKSGKLFVDKTWTGEAKVNFAVNLQKNVVPAANGASNGDFAGTLKMQYGLTLAGKNGTLTVEGINADLVLDANSQALCPVCNTTVTWTAFSGNSAGSTGLGTINDGTHRHIYLSADANAKNVPNMFLNLMSSSKLCLHLNGHTLTYGGYIMVAGGTTMNIIGRGSTSFTDTNEKAGHYDISGIYGNGGTINIYGGTHGVSGRALELDKPTVHMVGGAVNVKNAVLQNINKIAKGTMTLEETAQVENLRVETAGKMVVKSSWSGEANVSFAAPLVDYKVPAANAGAENGFTGTLWLPDGSKLKRNQDGVLVATGVNTPLLLNENSQAECPICEEVVTWALIEDGKSIGWKPNAGHLHYYLASDVTSRANSQFTELELGTMVCLHLNGNDLTLLGQCRLWRDSVLNIMGTGNVDYVATAGAREDFMEAGVLSLGGTANLYGGTYTVSGVAAETGKPAVLLRNYASAQVTVVNATISGPTRVELGNLTLQRQANAADIQVSMSGKLTVSENWSGTAQADFDAMLEEHLVPAKNAAAEGDFKGILTMPDDSRLYATQQGMLKREVILSLDANAQALCPACNEIVTWTVFSGNSAGTQAIPEINDSAAHYHYYLTGDVNARNVTNFFLNLRSGKVCLHLNGHALYHGGYIMVSGTLNMMGSGEVVFTATNTNHGNYDISGVYVNGGTVNLYGGTYSVAEDALAEGKATIHQNNGKLTIQDATVIGRLYIPRGTTTLKESATLENIQVDASAKLTVDASWAGVADVNFAAGMTDGMIPAANGTSTGDFAGGLRLADGTLLVGENGRLVEKNDTRLRINEAGIGYCQLCDQVAKWKAVNNGGVIGTLAESTDMHHHYYFAEDSMTTAAGKYFLRVYKGNTVCLHLNDKTVTVTGAMQVNDGGVLNVLGDGKVDFLGNTGTSAADLALFHMSNWGEKKLNLYGGTYTSSGKQILLGNGGNFTVNMIAHLYGNTHLDGLVTLTQSQLHLHDSARVNKIEGSNTASIRVAENWRGGAVVEYLNEQVNDYISEYNGRSGGDFIGGLMLSDGRRLIGESGKLRIVEAKLMLTEQNEGYCEKCNAVVTWKPVEGNNWIGFFEDGIHRHYYLSNDLNMPDTNTQVLGLLNTSCCLHLNGHNMTQGSRIFATGESSVLSIMGPGKVTFTASSTVEGEEYRVAGICVLGNAQVNLLGGTYCVDGKALEQNKPTISGIGRVYIKNARINGWVENSGRTVTLDGTTTVDKIVVGATEKLILEDSWKGAATVAFKAPLVGNALPAGKLAGTAHSGTLTLTDGRSINGTTIGGEHIDEKLTYNTSETDAQIICYAGEGDFLLPAYIAGKPVTAIADDAFASFTGTLYIGKQNTQGLTYAQEKGLEYEEIDVFTREDGVLQLQTDGENLTFEKDTVLDLNGHNVSGVTVTSGTLFVMDSQTDDYTVKDGVYGKITGINGTVKAAENYLQVTEENVVSFHRVNLELYAMSLRSSNVGVYYKSYFAGDEVVASQVESFGVALSVAGTPTASNINTKCRYSSFTNFLPGEGANAKNGTGTLLKNIMKTSNSELINIRNSTIPVYGRAYIKTADGYIFGKAVTRTLQEQVELVDEFFEALSHKQKMAVQEMCETYNIVTEKWDITNIGNYKDRIWFDTPAPDTGAGFEQYAIPLGNGYTGISVFGGTESELLSISDKTMFNPGVTGEKNAPPASDTTMQYGQGGLTNMSKAYIDFGHEFAQVTDYQRDLVMDTAQAHVRYTYDGVTYNRTYFASYPDNVLVTKLEASESGKLSFTLRPVATFVRDHAVLEGDGHAKTGTVTASGNTAIVAGMLTTYQINYETQYRVIPVGGTMKANDDGTITVENADSAVILMSAGTNYELKPETLTASNKEKLDPNSFPHDKVTAVLDAAEAKTYEQLLETHLADYQALYGSVELDLGGTPSTELTTSDLMSAYRAGNSDPYLEELLFQYGRYLLIASSRSGTLPANLQGIWQYYPAAAWDGQYVYNINLQMNYWGCFATNLAELFEPNIEFFDAIYPTLQSNADNYLTGIKSPHKAESGTGANGIAIGSTGTPYRSPSVSTSVSTHTGPGSTGYTSDLFWQYYQFTKDDTVLKEKIYPYLEGSATFLSKTLEDYDGKWLVSHSASPENNLYFDDSIQTVGTMFDQMMTRESFVQLLEAARLLKYTSADSPILSDIEAKLPLLDPVNVGKNGHVKEYREEEYYGELGLYEHHGMGQLVGVYPGTTITSKTNAWQDAAAATAIERGINFTGHQASFKQLVWARLGDGANSYLVAQEHIVKYIRDNLLNTHSPFQIDGNFGYTAGVAEMLIQSHEGYIKVLPALPQQWNTGSYKGLTARGGFEVDAEWTDGNVTRIAITSNAGQPCSLNHFRVSAATVVDSKGNPVTFTVENEDLITFATVEGETYTITNLSAKPNVEAPADLTYTDGTKLSWEASADAVSYKVYRAVNDQATYELIAENVTETSYTYAPTDLKAGDQLILRVTAVNADGVESKGIRTICWMENEE